MDQYTDFGKCFLARRCAAATVSNHPLLIVILLRVYLRTIPASTGSVIPVT
jgi:hypothetical protein